MLQKLQLVYQNNRNIIRIVRYTLISFLLLIFTWVFDYKYPFLKRNFPDVILLSPEVTSSFLSNLSGTFLTVSTFTLTTILTLLNKYSDSFTPRIVQDFIDQPNVLSLFGVFIGGFFYTVLSLFMIQNLDSKLPLVSGTIGVFYALSAMISFVLFVRRILYSVKVSNVIENIYTNAENLIETESENRKISEKFEEEVSIEEFKIYADNSGYFYGIDKDNILQLLENKKCQLIIDKRIGDFVLKGMKIANLNVLEDFEIQKDNMDELLNKISSSLVINISKNDKKDYHHEITNLVEISLRALSPGINDPNTAIEAIRKIGILLGKLLSSDRYYVVIGESTDCKIIYNSYTAGEELYLSFNQILHYGKQDPLVAQSILNSIHLIYLVAGDAVHEQIEEFFKYCYKLCLNSMENTMDKHALETIYREFYSNMHENLEVENN